MSIYETGEKGKRRIGSFSCPEESKNGYSEKKESESWKERKLPLLFDTTAARHATSHAVSQKEK